MAQRYSSVVTVDSTAVSTMGNSGGGDRKKSALMPSRKSVDFAILPPPAPKRSRTALSPLSGCWTPKQVVDAIATSITDAERLQALEKAVESFQHDVQSVHNDEMTCGADAVLTKALSYHLVVTSTTTATTAAAPSTTRDGGSSSTSSGGSSAGSCSSSNAPTNSGSIEDSPTRIAPSPLNRQHQEQLQQQQQQHELALLCQALESVYRAESHLVAVSFARMGAVLVGLLQRIIGDELTRRATAFHATTAAIASAAAAGIIMDEEQYQEYQEQNPYGDAILRHGTKLLGHFARVGDATEPLATFPGLLPTLIRLIATTHATGTAFDVPWEARLSAVWILANLACNVKNMERMVDTEHLVPCLMEVASRPRNGSDSVETAMEKLRSKSTASRAILNLSWAAANKEKLADHPYHPHLLELLCNLSLYRTDSLYRSRTVVDILINTRRYAVGALRNLAAAPRKHKIALCHYRNGHLLDVLTDAALNDTDQAVKDRAFAAIHNLAVHDTAPLIIGRPALVMALKDVLIATPSTSATDVASALSSTNTASYHEEQQQQQQQQQQLQHPHPADGTPREHASATLMVLERSITPSMDSYQNLRELLDELHRSSRSSSSNSSNNNNNNKNRNKE